MIANATNIATRYCSLFGSRHLRTFDGRFQTCANEGAYPVVDNQYLLIQITHSNLASAENAITKVAKFLLVLNIGNIYINEG